VHHEPLTSFALLAVVFLPAFCAGVFFLLFGFFIIYHNQIPQRFLMNQEALCGIFVMCLESKIGSFIFRGHFVTETVTRQFK